jgi:hypothetical protein
MVHTLTTPRCPQQARAMKSERDLSGRTPDSERVGGRAPCSAHAPVMSTTKQLPRDQWKEYFDRFTKEHLKDDKPEAATVEVISPTLGDQFEVTAVRLLGLAYDSKSQAFEVLLENVDHLIFRPTEIWVLEGQPGFISTLEVVRPDGIKEIIYIRRSGPPAPRYQFPLGSNVGRTGGDDRSGPANRR